MRGAGLLLLWCTVLPAQQGSIEGVVVSRAGGNPLPGVHVRLISAAFDGVIAAYGGMSDKAGHFSIGAIKPGNYLLMPEYPGFLYIPPKSDSPLPSLQIRAGQKIENYKLELTPRAVIAGRIVDEYGDPVANLSVQLVPVSPEYEVLNLFGGQNRQSDDRGEFRIPTAPGRFYLKALAYSGSNDPQEIRTDGSSDIAYGSTYYPSATTKDRGAVIEAIAGKDIGGLEIRLVRQRSFTISGTVTGIPDSSGNVQVSLRYGESPQQLNSSRGDTAARDGKFTFSKLPAGYYKLHARYFSANLQLQSGPVDVVLESGDAGNVELALGGMGEMSGILQAVGLPPEKRTVRLQNRDSMLFGGGPLSGAVDADGSFKIANVPPGKYGVAVDPMPDDGYVKTVQLDGAAAPNGVLDLSRGAHGSRLKIVAASGAGQLSGKVLDKDGQPIANSLAFVFLMTDPKAVAEESMARVSPDGSYVRKGIRPGRYRVFALDLLLYIGMLSSGTEELAEPFSRGEEIEIKEGERIVKDLKVLEKKEAGAKKQ